MDGLYRPHDRFPIESEPPLIYTSGALVAFTDFQFVMRSQRRFRPRLASVLALVMTGVTSLCVAQTPTSSLENQLSPAITALKSGDLDKASQILAEALQEGIRHPLVYHNLGVIAQMRGQHQAAVNYFRQALALEPDSGASRLLLGASLLAMQKNVEAKDELQRAVKLMPQQPEARLQLAKAMEATGEQLAATEQLRKVIELAPEEPEYAYQMGKSWMKLSGWSYRQIARIDPHSARLQQGLGQEYADQEKYDLALAAFERAAKTDPNLPEVHLMMSEILLKQGKYEQALQEIEREQKLVPQSKAARELRSEIEKARASAGS
jgi:Tfp pilus assembly protein PilF